MNLLALASGENELTQRTPPGFPDRQEIEHLWHIGLFSPDDERVLRKAWRILQGQTDDYLDMVLGMVAAYPSLAEALTVLQGETMDGSTTLQRRFRQWLLETCLFPREPPWIKELYFELLQNPSAPSVATRLPRFRYVIALAFPLVATARSFLAAGGRDPGDIERMQYALLKTILLQVGLLSKLYVKEELW